MAWLAAKKGPVLKTTKAGASWHTTLENVVQTNKERVLAFFALAGKNALPRILGQGVE
jgi:photosystem II stability/assembly factor-like uncharacterized protein